MLISSTPIQVLPKLSMVFQPEAWNDHRIACKTNCLAYALDRPDLGFPFLDNILPASALEKEPDTAIQERLKTSASLHIKLLFTGLTRIREHQYSPDTHHVIAYSPFMQHFFRLDGDRTWSHKQGSTEVTNKDNKGQAITNPETADFGFRAFDNRAFYIRAQQTIEEARKDRFHSPRIKQELIQRQREYIRIFTPSDAKDKKTAYFALPQNGLAVIPKALA